jgi:2-polyprenyl-3-methyl-5-hydroxy-6-metoxy-1,4-benzoquinol methylase
LDNQKDAAIKNINEEQIRPQVLMAQGAGLQDEDIKDTLAHSSDFVEVNCPACDSLKRNSKFTKKGFDFVECRECETLYVSPRPTVDMLIHLSKTSKDQKFYNDFVFPASEDHRRTHIFMPRARAVADLCEKYQTPRKLLLDVGAGFGTFCEEMKKLNFFERVVALEPAPDSAATCRKKGLEVMEMALEEIPSSENEISVITNFELIEHLFSPQEFVESCAKSLPTGGLLILTTPNIKGFDLATLGILSENILAPYHINYFHPDSLSVLLDRCGFDTVEVLTPGILDADIVRKFALNGELDLKAQPFLKKVLVDDWDQLGLPFQSFLSENKLSSHLWVVAKKRELK